jgi:hypothetical protein
MGNFTKKKDYKANQFSDVKSADWYSVYVKKCFELDLVSGKTNNYFGAQDNISVAEVITLASKIHSIYNGADIDLSKTHGIKKARFDIIKKKIIDNYALAEMVVEFKGLLSMSMIHKLSDEYPSIKVLRKELREDPIRV